MKKKNKKNIAATNGVMQAISTERDHLEAYSALHAFWSISIILKVSADTRTAGKWNCNFFFCWYKNPASPLAL